MVIDRKQTAGHEGLRTVPGMAAPDAQHDHIHQHSGNAPLFIRLFCVHSPFMCTSGLLLTGP